MAVNNPTYAPSSTVVNKGNPFVDSGPGLVYQNVSNQPNHQMSLHQNVSHEQMDKYRSNTYHPNHQIFEGESYHVDN